MGIVLLISPAPSVFQYMCWGIRSHEFDHLMAHIDESCLTGQWSREGEGFATLSGTNLPLPSWITREVYPSLRNVSKHSRLHTASTRASKSVDPTVTNTIRFCFISSSWWSSLVKMLVLFPQSYASSLWCKRNGGHLLSVSGTNFISDFHNAMQLRKGKLRIHPDNQ